MERAPLVVERGFVGRDEAAASIESHSELPQMMIQMFVHQDRPFVWFHRPKEGMRMVGAACGASSDKLVNQSVEPDLLSTKIPIVRHHQFPGGGRIAAHRLSFPNTARFIAGPTIRPINALGGRICPIAISTPAEQCASICAGLILPQTRWLSGFK